MINKINTYEALLQEEQRLSLLLLEQKQLVKQDIAGIKEEFEPVSTVFSIINKTLTRDTGNWLMNSAANKAIDLVVKKMILGKAGWLTKLVVPFFLKNYSSHFIANHKEEISDKLFSWVRKAFSSNGKGKQYNEEESPTY